MHQDLKIPTPLSERQPEIWAGVPSFVNYEISSWGRARSLDHDLPNLTPDNPDYLKVLNLRLS